MIRTKILVALLGITFIGAASIVNVAIAADSAFTTTTTTCPTGYDYQHAMSSSGTTLCSQHPFALYQCPQGRSCALAINPQSGDINTTSGSAFDNITDSTSTNTNALNIQPANKASYIFACTGDKFKNVAPTAVKFTSYQSLGGGAVTSTSKVLPIPTQGEFSHVDLTNTTTAVANMDAITVNCSTYATATAPSTVTITQPSGYPVCDNFVASSSYCSSLSSSICGTGYYQLTGNCSGMKLVDGIISFTCDAEQCGWKAESNVCANGSAYNTTCAAS